MYEVTVEMNFHDEPRKFTCKDWMYDVHCEAYVFDKLDGGEYIINRSAIISLEVTPKDADA